MKCIKYKTTKDIVRTSNEVAADAVDSGRADFVSKSEWRNSGSEREGPQESIGKVSIHPPVNWHNQSNRKPGWAK